ncbi:aspartate 1-decarboxylase autocleavage activator PanM [Psychromonas sp. RZ22]|uniref:aspartate 1-decarboxylase autocleavage activator PanM n=1 Tax=Psychromonas algarum TaxID=2555643 RepID=UPI001067A065|nr:aspartate 1-decarboxylase autocleavage activator PanM [Psychromonas sp. RZ22]TEW53545.1 aspartate 1-decarboxylase autocleavage activator PanM [Psychromonas sp. RZ22]
MRLSVFIANTLSTQLVIDLQKIYLNYLVEDSLTQQAIQQLLEQDSTRLYVTMFNERHIGAVKVQTKATQATLSQLCIRDITRRRGVGKNLLKQIESTLHAEGIEQIQYNLQEVAKDEYLSTQAFLMNSGYIIKDTIASKAI